MSSSPSSRSPSAAFRRSRSSSACVPGSTAFPGRGCSCRRSRICISAARQTAAEYQYTLSGDDAGAIYSLVPKLIAELGKHPDQLTDVNTDMQQNGLQTYVTIDRATAARYGFTPNQIDAVLYDAFGQRTVSTIYNPYNQYFVVMEVAPKYCAISAGPQPDLPQHGSRQCDRHAADADAGRHGKRREAVRSVAPRTASSSANALNANAQANLVTNAISNGRGGTSSGSADSTAAETMVPLSALARSVNNHTAIQVNHQGGQIAATLSFNLPPGGSLSSAQTAIDAAMRDRGRARLDPRRLPGFGAGFRSIAGDHTALDPRRAGHRLYRAGHSLREHHPSADHPVDAALGRDRRHAGAAAVRRAVLDDRADRHHPAHRHRQEKRHHDDRCRDPSGARRRNATPRRPFTRPPWCACGRS